MEKLKKINSFFKIEWMKFRFEKTFSTENCKLKYLFFPEDSPYLLITFSGFSRKGMGARYNYVRSFENLKANKLYILDNYGPDDVEGSYYLGKNGDFFIARAVEELIEKIQSKHHIKGENIITAGSSKGGYAAIYFALKKNFKAAVVGAPQIYLADYLEEVKMNYIDYIMGDHSPQTRDTLNQVLVREVKEGIPTRFYIHISTKDHHYPNHILPFIKLLEEKSISYELDLENYEKHGLVGEYYKIYGPEKISELINE